MRCVHTVAITLLVAVLVACSSYPAKTEKSFDAQKSQTDALNDQQTAQFQQKQPVQFNAGYYFGSGQTVKLSEKAKLPAVFSQSVTLVTPPLYLFEMTDKISDVANMPVEMDPLLLQEQQSSQSSQTSGQMLARQGVRLSLDYQGTLSGLLNTVSSHFGISWEYQNGTIRFFKYETRMYMLNILPGTVGNSSVVTNKSNLGGSSGSGGNSGGSMASSSQTVSAQQQNDVWKSIVASIHSMLTKDGTVVDNEDAGTMSVTDTPQTQQQVAAYVDSVNTAMARQVAVTVRIYALDISNQNQKSFNLAAVFTNLKAQFGLTTIGVTPSFDTSGSSSLSATVLNTAGNTNAALGQWAGSQLLANVLNEYGKVSLVTEGSGIAMQGQPLPIQVTTTQGYLASSSSTSSTVTSGTTTALQPGQVTTGFSLVITPRIMQTTDIVMQYVLDLSNLNSIQTISSGGQEIQVPSVSSRRFIQRVQMRSGSMLVLAGYEQINNSDQGGNGVLSWFRGTSQDHQILFVTISANVI